MVDQWGQFQDAEPHDEWGQFKDVPASPAPAQRKGSLTLGVLEGMLPAAKKLAPYSPANLIPGFKQANERAIPRAEARIAEREKTQTPNIYGKIAGQIGSTAWVPGGPFKAVAPLVQGAAQGYLLSDQDSAGGQLGDAAGGALLNHFGGKAVDALADAIKPTIAPAVQRLRDAGVKLTPGMVKGGEDAAARAKAMAAEDKAMSKPVVGDQIAAGRGAARDTMNTAAVNRALEPLGIKVPTPVKPGQASIDYAHGEIGRAYDQVIPHLAVRINGQQFGQNVAQAGRNLAPAQQAHLQQIVSNELGNGQLAGQQLKDAQGEIRRLATNFTRSENAHDQQLGQALWAVDDELSGAMIAQNPRFAPQLQKVNQAYRGYRIVADAASRSRGGVSNVNKLETAVRRADPSKNKDLSARGKAFMQDFTNDLGEVIPAITPDSGTAGRNQAANIFARLGGASDALGYQADNIYQNFRLMPRPAAAEPAAQAVRRLRRPVSATAIAASQNSRD